MNDTGLNVMAGVAQGIEKASQNLFNISVMKYKRKQEEEAFALDKKVKEATLKKMEFLYGPEQLAAEREKTKAESAAQEALFNLRTKQISGEEIKNQKALEDLQKEKQLRVMAGVGTLKDLGMSDEQARYTLATMWSPKEANVGGQSIQVAPPEFVEKAMSFDRGENADAISAPVINAEAERLRQAAGITQEQAGNNLYGIKEEKAPSYTEDYRVAIEKGSDRIRNGEKSDTVIKELRAKYPASMNFEREWTLQQIEKDAKQEISALQNKATKMLQDAKYPVTENNIKEAIKQLRGR